VGVIKVSCQLLMCLLAAMPQGICTCTDPNIADECDVSISVDSDRGSCDCGHHDQLRGDDADDDEPLQSNHSNRQHQHEPSCSINSLVAVEAFTAPNAHDALAVNAEMPSIDLIFDMAIIRASHLQTFSRISLFASPRYLALRTLRL
jgi:hypothetical protein